VADVNDVVSYTYKGVTTYGKVVSILPNSTMVVVFECDRNGVVEPLTCREAWDSASENFKLVIKSKS
jgi:hypothetical protein